MFRTARMICIVSILSAGILRAQTPDTATVTGHITDQPVAQSPDLSGTLRHFHVIGCIVRAMSRLRRLVLSDRSFFIFARFLPHRTMTDPEFELKEVEQPQSLRFRDSAL